MAGLNLPSLKIDILADGSSAIKEIKSVQETAQEMERIGGQMTKFTTAPIVTALTAAVKSAGDFNETLGKTEVVFGGMTESVMQWSESAIDTMGIAQATALEMASTYGDMATGMGLANAESAQMSMNLTELAADIASFKNKSVQDVNTALMGIFTGETESLKQLGVVMTQANLQQFAYTQGITENVAALSQAEQVQLRYSYVMAQTANAQGDFVRTGDSLNNQTKKLTETIKELASGYGALLTEKVAGVIGKLQEGVQYLAELDDGAKNTIITIGLIVAAAGPLLLVGGKVLTLVTTLKTSLLALAANPVALGLLGAVTALSALVAVAKNAGEGLDKTSKTYQNLKRAIEGGTTGSITINADTQGALDDAQDLLDKLNSGDYDGMIAIDGDPGKAETALTELEAAVNAVESSITIGADGSTVMGTDGELERLQAAIDAVEGLIVITEDPATKAQLELYIAQLKQDLQSLGVEVEFTETDETALNIQAFKDKLAGLPKDETYRATGEFKVTEATAETIQEYAEAVAAAATATGDYADAVSDLNNIVDQETARKVAEVNGQIAEYAREQAAELNEGIITQDQYNANVEQAIKNGEQTIRQIESEAEARKELNQVYADGIKNNDPVAAAAALGEIYADETFTQEQINQAGQRLGEAHTAGTLGSEESQIDAQITLAALRKETIADQEALTAAAEKYDQAIGTANANEQEAAKLQQEKIDMYAVLLDMLGAYYSTIQTGEDAESAMQGVLSDYAEEIQKFEGGTDLFKNILTGEDGELLGGEEISQLQTVFDSLVDIQEQAKQRMTTITEEATAAREAALQEFTTTLAGIQEGYTASEAAGALALVEQTGVAVSELDRSMIEGGTQAIADLASTLSDGTDDVQGAIDTALTAAGSAAATTGENEGVEIGGNITDGVADGIANGTGKAIAAAILSAKRVTAAYKSALDIQSPSGVMRDEVGVMMMEGIGVGIEQALPSVLDIVRRSTGSIISSATSVTNNGAYTVPITAAAVPTQQEAFDYDRLARAMAQRPIAFSVGAEEMAVATRDAASRQQALRVRELSAGYGFKGEIK